MAPAADGELVLGSVEDEMRTELTTLLDAVSSGEVSHADFYHRLEEIHDRHLGDSAKTAEHALIRRKALTAFEDLGREAPSRHHELELLAEALGIPYS
jgi:hypothetical protein